MQINNEKSIAEPLFTLPIKLKENFELQEFHSQYGEMQHLIIVNERHFKLNQAAFILIKLIEKSHSLDEIALEYSNMQSQKFTTHDIILIINKTIVPIDIVESDEQNLLRQNKSFLSFKFTLFSATTLKPITGKLCNLFNPNIAKVLLFLIVASHYFVIVNYFGKSELTNLSKSPSYLFWSAILILGSIMFHELGHASACRYFGAKHKEIGFGLYIIFPVFYSNITDSWRLKPMNRAYIDIGGIYFQYIFNLILLCLYFIDGNILFLDVIKIVCIQSVLTLNPFFRFDGYWLATDLLDIPNLRKRTEDYIQFLIKRYILHKNIDHFKLAIHPIAKLIFFFYAIASNLFFIYFIYIISKTLPNMLIEFPETTLQAQHSISNYYLLHDFNNLGSILYQYTFKLVILSLLLYFSARLILGLYKGGIKFYNSIVD